MRYHGHIINQASPTGGKAGKGFNKTSTIRVFDGNLIKKQFRFTMNNPQSKARAIEKAKAFIDGPNYCPHCKNAFSSQLEYMRHHTLGKCN